jgi:rubrerythrin
MKTTTRENLRAAMRGEAFAHAKYMLFARRARESGHHALAELFEQTARLELDEHFLELADLADLAGSDVENLADAITGETHESETMYREFAAQAERVGDQVAAARFEEIRRDEARHREAFRAALYFVNDAPLVAAGRG